MSAKSQSTVSGRELLAVCCKAVDATKAENIVALDVSKQSSITDYLLLATGNSQPHLKAIKRDLDKALKERHVRVLGVDEGLEDSGWSVVDAFEVMIHIFTPDTRDTYRLESLWKDAEPIEVEPLLK